MRSLKKRMKQLVLGIVVIMFCSCVADFGRENRQQDIFTNPIRYMEGACFVKQAGFI